MQQIVRLSVMELALLGLGGLDMTLMIAHGVWLAWEQCGWWVGWLVGLEGANTYIWPMGGFGPVDMARVGH